MTLAEMLPSLGSLSRPEKEELVRLLSGQLAQRPDAASVFPAGVEYECWSQWDAYEAAATIEAMLREQGQTS